MSTSAPERLDAAYAALDTGDFDGALEHLRAAIAERSPEAHDLYAALMLADDRIEDCRTHWERAFRLYREVGNERAAIKAVANIAWLYFDDHNITATRGWVNRGRRMAEKIGRCVELGYLELALLACDVNDASTLEAAATSALELAVEFGDASLESRALADLGVALITQGRIDDGFARLDESMALLSAGEVTDLAQAGSIFCAMLTACERTGDIARAEDWLRACRDFQTTMMLGKFPVLTSHCRIAYGRVLCDAGRLSEAETEATAARGPEGTALVSKQASAAALQADVMMLQGRLEDAAEVLAPYLDRFEVCEQLARLHLLRAELDLAAATCERALGQLGPDRMRGAPLLGMLVQVELHRGEVDAAESAAERLADLAAGTQGPAVAAEAALAGARVAMARGEHTQAAAALQQARRALSEGQRPVLAARLALEHARALTGAGEAAAATDEARGALAAFERLEATREADEAAALLRTLGSPGRSRPRASGEAAAALTGREREVLALIAEGLTNAEIAERLFITPKTAEHHVGRILSKLGVRSRTEAATLAARSGA